MAVEIHVPELGESVADATVGRWLKQEGEAVKSGDALVELETDKINFEVEAEQDGVLESISRGEGETVNVGEVIGTLGDGAAPAQTEDDQQEEQPQAEAGEAGGGARALRGLRREQLDPAQVLDVDEAVVRRGDEPHRRAVLGGERGTVEVVGEQHVVGERVLEQHHRPVPVETGEARVRRRRGRSEHLGQRNALPAQPPRRPPGDAVEVCEQRPPWERREVAGGDSPPATRRRRRPR